MEPKPPNRRIPERENGAVGPRFMRTDPPTPFTRANCGEPYARRAACATHTAANSKLESCLQTAKRTAATNAVPTTPRSPMQAICGESASMGKRVVSSRRAPPPHQRQLHRRRRLFYKHAPPRPPVPVPVPAAEPVPMQRRMLAPASQPRGPEAHLRDASSHIPYASNIRVHNATADAHIKTSMKIRCMRTASPMRT